MWISYVLKLRTGEAFSVLESHEEYSLDDYTYVHAKYPELSRAINWFPRTIIEKAKIGDDRDFTSRLKSGGHRLAQIYVGRDCAEKSTCKSYKTYCNPDPRDWILKKLPLCFDVGDSRFRDLEELCLEACRTNSIVIVPITDH